MSLSTQFTQSRTCARCGNEESRSLGADIAAFEERRQWTSPCGRCSSHEFSAIGTSTPPVDAELLEEWSRDAKLSFSQQDEDLLLADGQSLPLLKQFVQRQDILASKRAVLLSALCVLIFDNTPDPDDPDADYDADVATTVADFLSANLWLFDEIDDGYIYDYIKTDVYPQIGLTPNET